ncbi:acyl-ACP--UDP-N- acetylglucosamine O-acyltransferase [Plantibacter sp. MCCC 1A11337]|uniref:acyl-ACP--UDP-N- acetylglucosamine O-acyltransferase n=1 Tax=Plantibacter sp. MCCC 1A11337 TaxID=2736644 RepID=UPI0015835E66|nr:acyl-ACP--UDP-N- acetylglucosamine O-acyltransferase [Plantibacter sp. MCCC 1A11337]NUJ89310.1 acyl-ACP--UDP-N- acetylglucosamine O-acyltransferase [Plantibacter sp. MCCC 1A11337]
MNTLHPTAIISGEVTMGEGNVIGPFVVITGPVSIGDDNWIGAGAVIGAIPEVRSFPHLPVDGPDGLEEPRGVRIGDHTVIREYSQVHQGWQAATVIGDRAFIMNQSYIAHDCQIGADVTIAGGARLAGHVRVGDGANIGLGALVHQRREIGRGAMVGMGSVVTRDVPDFAKAYGNPVRVHGLNLRGAQAAGYQDGDLALLAAAFDQSGEAPR